METNVPPVSMYGQRVRQQLCQQHYWQMVVQRPQIEMAGMVALMFEPARRSPSFLEQKIRKIGSTTLILATFVQHPHHPERLSMPIYGLSGIPLSDGSVVYGGPYGVLFRRDGAVRPRQNAIGQAIDIDRHPGLLDIALGMVASCRRRLSRREYLPQVPRLPRILLGFAPSSPPAFQDTSALRRIVAAKVNLPIRQLGCNDHMLLERMLRDAWSERLIQPTDADNPTGLLLVDAELCTDARRSLGIFEDVRALCGQHTRNPARSVALPTIDNPAPSILQRLGIDPDQDFDQSIPDEVLGQLELEMREALGGAFARVDQSVVFDALTNPRIPVTDFAAALPKIRANLPARLQSSCTDSDLVRAIGNQDQSLLVSGSGRIQVIEGAPTGNPFGLSQAQLQRRIRLSLSLEKSDGLYATPMTSAGT